MCANSQPAANQVEVAEKGSQLAQVRRRLTKFGAAENLQQIVVLFDHKNGQQQDNLKRRPPTSDHNNMLQLVFKFSQRTRNAMVKRLS